MLIQDIHTKFQIDKNDMLYKSKLDNSLGNEMSGDLI